MLKRDPEFIAKHIYEKAGTYYTKEKTIIEFPSWYADKELYIPQEVTTLYGLFAIIIGDKYSVSIVPTFIKTNPIMVTEIERDGVMYTQLIYGKDDPIMQAKSVIKHALSSYTFFETRIVRAKEAWFIEPDDNIFALDNMKRYTGTNLGDNFIANELVSGFIARDAKDKTKFYRQVGNKGDYEYVNLLNVYYSRLSTASRLAGNYLKQSVNSAIVQHNDNETKLETHLRT